MSKSPHPIDVVVGQNLKHMRKGRKWSQTALGNELGITFQQIQKYEKGTNRISASRLAELSLLFDVPVADFFDGTGIKGASDKPAIDAETLRIASDVSKLERPAKSAIRTIIGKMIEASQ